MINERLPFKKTINQESLWFLFASRQPWHTVGSGYIYPQTHCTHAHTTYIFNQVSHIHVLHVAAEWNRRIPVFQFMWRARNSLSTCKNFLLKTLELEPAISGETCTCSPFSEYHAGFWLCLYIIYITYILLFYIYVRQGFYNLAFIYYYLVKD